MLKKARLGIMPVLPRVFSFCSLEVYNKRMPMMAVRYTALTYKIKTCTTVKMALQTLQQNFQQIEQVGKTIILDYFNEFYMDPKFADYEKFIELNQMLDKLTNLNLYEKSLKLGILHKTKLFYRYRNNLVDHDRLVRKTVQEIIEDIDLHRDSLSINDYFNVLMVFRVQIHENLIAKCLELINLRKLDIEQNLQYVRVWKILFHQFSFYPWILLRKYGNIIKFFTMHFSWKKETFALTETCEFFQDICKLQLHLVGERKIPKCIQEIINLLMPRIKQLSSRNIYSLIHGYSFLPARYQTKFKVALINRLDADNQINNRSIHFPIRDLPLEQFQKYCKEQNLQFFWYCLLYRTQLEDIELFLRPPMVDLFKNYIDKQLQSITNAKKVGEKRANDESVSRLCTLAYYFQKNKNTLYMGKLKVILAHHLRVLGSSICKQLSFANFLTLMALFANDSLSQQIFILFKENLGIRREKINLYQNKVSENCLHAIRFHINTNNPLVQQCLVLLAKEVASGTGQITDEQVRLLIELTKIEVQHHPMLNTIKQKLWNKIGQNEIQLVLDYYSLDSHKSLKSLAQIFRKLIEWRVPPLIPVKFLSTLTRDNLQTPQGRLDRTISTYLNENTPKIIQQLKNGCLQNLNEMSRLIGVLSSFHSTQNFRRNLYLAMINCISEEIWENSSRGKVFSLKGRSSRGIVNFIMKFEETLSFSNPFENKTTLWKIYKIFCTLLEEDDGPYLKTKFLEFVLIYKQYIAIPEGAETYPLFSVLTILQSAKNLPQLTEILLIMLKLDCMGLQKLENSKILQYTSVISLEIQQGRLSVLKVLEKVNATNLHIQLLRFPKTDAEGFRKVLSPLYLKAIQTSNFIDIHILKPFLNYFYFTNEIHYLSQPLTRILANRVTPMAISTIIQQFPTSSFSFNLFQIMLKRLDKISFISETFGIQFLFFLEKLFYQTPAEYEAIYEKYWKISDDFLQDKILKMEKNKHLPPEKQLLGRFPLYLFACIKRGRTMNNKVYSALAQFVVQNQGFFLKIIRSNQLLMRINFLINEYIKADYGAKKQAQNNEVLKFVSSRCDKLQKRLRKEGVQFKRFQVLKNVSVPYFCPKNNQIIFIGSEMTISRILLERAELLQTSEPTVQSQQNLDQQQQKQPKVAPFYGILKFEVTVCRKILPEYKVKVYNEFSDQFFQ